MKAAWQLLCTLPLTRKLPVSAQAPWWMYQLSNTAKLKHSSYLSTQGIPFSSLEGEHMWKPSTGQKMPPCPTVYALAALVFSQECLLCHLTTPLGIFHFFFFLIQTISVNISQTPFSLILSAPWSSQESILHFWLFPSEGRKGKWTSSTTTVLLPALYCSEAGPEIASKYTSKCMEKQSPVCYLANWVLILNRSLWVHGDSEHTGFVWRKSISNEWLENLSDFKKVYDTLEGSQSK